MAININNIRYKVVRAGSVIELEDNVHKGLDRGFVPIGGVTILRDEGWEGLIFYAQAMYKPAQAEGNDQS